MIVVRRSGLADAPVVRCCRCQEPRKPRDPLLHRARGHRDDPDVNAAKRRWNTAHLLWRARIGDSWKRELLKRRILRLEILGVHAREDVNLSPHSYIRAMLNLAQTSQSPAPRQLAEDGAAEGTAGCAAGAAHGEGPAESASGDSSTIADGIGLRLAEMLAAS